MNDWVIPCNTKAYDVIGAFKEFKKIDWKQSSNVQKGAIVYIYVGTPISGIKYKCKAIEVDKTESTIDDSKYVIQGDSYVNYGRYMCLELLEEYPDNFFSKNLLMANGLKTIQGPSMVSEQLANFLSHSSKTINVKQNGKTRAQLILILMQAFGRPVTAREIMNIVYPGNKNESQISDELRYMLQQGKVVRTGTPQQYFYELPDKKKRNYFYVMQNKTFAEEYSGGYLWAPQQGNNGSAANHSWSRMQSVKAGDVIIHGYKQQVVAISIAKSDCYSAQRPEELVADWKREGWRVDSDYFIIDAPINPKNIWDELQPLLPSKYAPFTSDGSGNQGYLFEANIQMCQCILDNIALQGAPGKSVLPKKTVVNKTLQMKIEAFDKQVHDGEAEAIAKVKNFVSDYTVKKLMDLPKEDYVYGSGRKDTFCYRITHELMCWGSIRNGTPNKYGFYYDPNENKYQTVAKFGTADTEDAIDAAYDNVKLAIYELIVAGGNEDYAAIEKNLLSTILKGKLLCIYFPDKYMNIYSEDHIKFYMDILGIALDESKGPMTWLKQIIDWKNDNPVTKNWTNHEFSKFLYHGIGYPPDSEKQKKAVKKFEKKVDNALIESIDEVTESELPEDESYTPVPEIRKDPIPTAESYTYPRDKAVALKALKRANYQCECQESGEVHPGFIRKTNGTNYTEPHHLIPLSEQDNFEFSLDVPANIVSLCSNCHNQLHYGLDPVPLLTKLYEARKDELKAAGIEITLEELIVLYE